MSKVFATSKYSAVATSILIASGAALMLYFVRYIVTGTPQFNFMAWNLVLSLLALLSAIVCTLAIKNKYKWLAIFAAVVWLFLLPNTFYMLTDFIHIKETGDITIMFDIVLVGLFAMNGFLHGLLSLYVMHKIALKKLSAIQSLISVGVIILLASFAVDIGRYLRWNSWDVLLNPTALIFDVSDILLHPFSYNRSFLITAVFFVTISSLYAVFWQLTKVQYKK
ncbi:DUF1361 domain-containing protein [bacterium]|nr:DUF1361 domain-containing protein [bacterium]NBX97338.1 DUF1361 domain-containing protein [bacterium]NDC94915.1 DUF1361 domain-containing protein [bacterium]NDD84675.1 DUF1361 domain-containing protein [bacterium]NDG29205.1 DUF1361 domain-containing protein [bacterium]